MRIDRQGDKLVRVPDDLLQEKSHVPFVFEALSLPDGEVYVSEFGINHEDAAQEAAVPVFNMASPVVQAGQLRGVVVVRVAAAPFLHNFNAALPTPYGLYLSNRWGDFLMHPDATQTFGFDRGQRILIQESLPQVAALVDGRAEEAVLSQPGTDDEEARVCAFMRMPFGNAEEGPFMFVGLSQPLAVVQGEVLDLGAQHPQDFAGAQRGGRGPGGQGVAPGDPAAAGHGEGGAGVFARGIPRRAAGVPGR